MQFFVMFAVLTKLAVILIFQAIVAFVEGSGPFIVISSLLPTLVSPLLIIGFVKMRYEKSMKLRNNVAQALVEISESVPDTIANYYQRPAAAERFMARIRKYNAAFTAAAAC